MDYFGLESNKLRKVVVCGEPLHLPNKVVNLPLHKGRGYIRICSIAVLDDFSRQYFFESADPCSMQNACHI